MRRERARNFGGRPGKDHDELAADIDSREVVIVLLGDFESIAGEDQRRFNFGRGHDASADDGIFPERERFAFAPSRMSARLQSFSTIWRETNLTGW